MNKCHRCHKENVDIHTCTPIKYISECCDDKVTVRGDGGIGGTYYWECNQCRKPCDVR